MAATSSAPRLSGLVHRPGCRNQYSSSSPNMSRLKSGCDCGPSVARSEPPDFGNQLKLDFDFDSSFSVDFDLGKFDLDLGLGSLSQPAPATVPVPPPAPPPAPVTETRSSTAITASSATVAESDLTVSSPGASVPRSTSQQFSATVTPAPERTSPTLARSPSLPSLSLSPVSPATPTPIVATPTTPTPVGARIPGGIIKRASSSSDSSERRSRSITPPASVTFALPPPSTLRLPVIPSDERGSQPKRRVQVGAFGEVSWVSEPVRHTQVEARNSSLETSQSSSRPGSAAGSRPGSGWTPGPRGRVASPPNSTSSLNQHQRSHSWNSGQHSPSGRRRPHQQHDESKDWLIAYHVQQLTAERERKLAKLAQQQQQKKDSQRVLAPSPLSRDVGRTPSRLPSITEEASRPPRSTSLRAMPSTEPARSSSLSALTTGLKRPISDPHPPAPRQTIKCVHKVEGGEGECLACTNTNFKPTRAAPAPPGPTSPLAQEPITRSPTPPPAAAPAKAPPSPTITRRAVTPEPGSSPSSLGRRQSLLNLTLRRAARPLKIDFEFGFKNKGKHSRSNSQSSKTSDLSESSESSEDSFGTVETNHTVELIRTPTSPVSASDSRSTTPHSRVSAVSAVDATGSASSLSSFATCKSSLSAETLTLRTESPSPSSEGPHTPRSLTPTGSATPAEAASPTTPDAPGTPESEVIATPKTDVSVHTWPKQKGNEERVENDDRIVAAF